MKKSSASATLTRVAPFIFVGLWSTGFISAKYALPYIEPFYLLLIRVLITLALFAGLAVLFRSRWLTLPQVLHQFVVGSLVHGAYLGGVFAAIKLQMPAGITAILVGLQPLLTAFLAWSVFGERLSRRQWVGLLLGLSGVCLVLLSRQELGNISIRFSALLCAIVALLGITIGTLYQKRFGGGVDLLPASFFQYLATAVWMALLSFLFEDQQVDWQLPLIGALVWLVFGLSISAILLLMYMINEGEASKVASYFYLVPPLTAIEAWLLFGEVLSIGAIVGILITVMGVYFALNTPKQKALSG